MIDSDKELAVVREQMALIEHALDALRKRVKNPRTFAVYSEGYVDQMADLKAEIDAYLKKAKPKSNGVAKKRKAGKREQV
jgi:lysozyme family protein